jgi:4-hydroxyphenylacetate 3-monooxygenase
VVPARAGTRAAHEPRHRHSPVDRAKAAEKVKTFITIRRNRRRHLCVRRQVVATASALTHYNFLGQNSAAVPAHDTDLAVMFIAP